MDSVARFYSQPSYVGGINFPVYAGSRRQAGGSGIFGMLKRAIVPVLKSSGKALGRQALGLVTDVAGDVLQGRNIGQSIAEHGKRRATETASMGIDALKRQGTSLLNTPSKRRRTTVPNMTSSVQVPTRPIPGRGIRIPPRRVVTRQNRNTVKRLKKRAGVKKLF